MSGINLNSSGLAGSLEDYLCNSLITAYQSGWSALTDTLARDSNVQTQIWEPIQMLRADVSFWRIYLYLGLHLLLTLSGVMLIYIQSLCVGKTIEDSAISTIMLDNTRVVEHNCAGLCSAVALRQAPGSSKW